MLKAVPELLSRVALTILPTGEALGSYQLTESLFFYLIDDAAYDSDRTISVDNHLDDLSNQLRPAVDKTLKAAHDLSDESRTRAIARFMRSMSPQQKVSPQSKLSCVRA